MVTTRTPDGRPCGLTVTAFASVSLQPALVLACIEQQADTHDCILRAGCFAVAMLGRDQEPLARRFAAATSAEKFAGLAIREERTGAPVLEAALGWLDCRLSAHYPGGDHTIFVGEVLAGDARDVPPLSYYRSGYGGFTS